MVSNYTYLELYLDDLREKITLAEFEKHFNMPHQTIKSHLDKLLKAKVLVEEKKARFRFYSINLTNPLVIEYLAICEKERLISFLGKNLLFNRLYSAISPYLKENSVLLFGSAVNSKEYSDIDLLIFFKDNKIKEDLKKFEKVYSVKIQIVQSSEESLSKTLIQEIRKKHIILSNTDLFLRVLYKDEFGLV